MTTQVMENVEVNDTMEIKKEHEALLKAVLDKESISVGLEISINVRNGVGVYKTGWLPTFGATVKGSIHIMEPQTGSWTVSVYDDVQKKEVYRQTDVLPNRDYRFQFPTSFWGINATITGHWSKPEDTTMKVKVDVGL